VIDPILQVNPNITLREALKRLDSSGLRLLLVMGEDRTLLGIMTDGDVRRAILAGESLENDVGNTYNRNPKVLLRNEYAIEEVKKVFLENKYEAMPIVTLDNKVVDLLFWEDLFKDIERVSYSGDPVPLPVVIMAGGKGTRMAPFTTVLPKPLIPIGEKTILELIIDEFKVYGMADYYFTLNYRGEIIKAYFESIEKNYNLSYVWEKEFRGTAGCLALLKNTLKSTFLVSNCDIIVKANMANVYNFHKNNKAMLTIISSIQHHTIPYGVVEFSNGGKVIAIREKPEYSFPINTGVYILEPECLDYIPEDGMFHMTHLIEKLMSEDKLVCTYPINESEYVDIGQWDEYRIAVSQLATGLH
jgi:dTDP-glucose pyrophosphorylase